MVPALFGRRAGRPTRMGQIRLALALAGAFLAILIFAGPASPYPNGYWWMSDLGPGTAVSGGIYNNWYYNEIWPDSNSAPMGIWFNHTNGT